MEPSHSSGPWFESISSAENIVRTDICIHCKIIDWSRLAEGDFKKSTQKICEVGQTQYELEKSTCKICRLLALIKPPDLDGKTSELVALSSTVIHPDASSSSMDRADCPYLAFVGEGRELWRRRQDTAYIAVLQKDRNDYVGTKKIAFDAIDYSFIEEFVRSCHQGHKICQYDGPNDIRDLLVIDCLTKLVIPAPKDCHYLALSYVWGDAEPIVPEPSEADGNFPPVVADGITVTVALGCQYLWVDRYCIRDNGAHKTQMINQMDLIYWNAFLTIIAAAGEHAYYGLPGVGKTTRQPQAQVEIGDVDLVQQISVHPSASLEASKWSTRGWTCQEGFLSRRRLIFTDHQVACVCREMYVLESIMRPMEPIWALDNLAFEMSEHLVPAFRERLNNRTAETIRYLKDHIQEYSTRQLRFEEDALRAFLGVLRYYAKKRVNHLWGVPTPYWGYSGGAKKTIQFDWYHPSPAIRRSGFPSWSWTGWSGPVKWTSVVYRYDEDCHISVYAQDDSLIPIEKFSQSKLIDPGISNRLQVTARTIPLSFRHVHQTVAPKHWARRWTRPHYCTADSGVFAMFHWEEDVYVGATPLMDTEVHLEDGMLGLILHCDHRECDHEKGAHSGSFTILILQPVSDSYERIGMITLNIDEAPVYLDGRGNVLGSQPNMMQISYWKKSIWFEKSKLQTIHLV